MTRYQPSSELRFLIDRLLDEGPLSRAELARLEELLQSDGAMDYYLSVVQQDAALGLIAGDLQVALPDPVVRSSGHWSRVVGRLVAAVALFVAGYWYACWRAPVSGKFPGGDAAPVVAKPAVPAAITGMIGVRWVNGAPPDLIGTSGGAGEISFESGLLEITYASGVRVTLEGPARFVVTGAESGVLDGGKLVAAVPKGAEGFRIDYPDGTVVDLGTEFTMEVKSGQSSEVGVFDGEVELRRAGERPVALYENHAVRQAAGPAGVALEPVPLDRMKYVRRIPSREFAWEISSASPREIEFDVSHLLWKASAYRAVFKWVNGVDGISIRDVDLCLDGEVVASDPHDGATGDGPEVVRDSIYRLDVPSERFRTGKWTLRARVEMLTREGTTIPADAPIQTLGILQFEEGLVTTASPSDFVGRWSYRYLGSHFVREFRADGTAMLYVDGKALPECFEGCRWVVRDGILRISMPHTSAFEEHILRDRNTLIFINQNYENAIRSVAAERDPDS